MSIPYFPPTAFVLPEEAFDALIATDGIRLLWRKAHTCPCIFDTAGGTKAPGSADPQCQSCGGRGIYWDAPVGPFMGLLTWRHMSPTPDEFGAAAHETVGLLQHGEPTLSIPYNADTTGTIWNEASVYDAFVEIDATDRFNVSLIVGNAQAVPYQQGLNIPASGAVTVYQNHQAVPVSGYIVSGATVTLPSGYAPGTSYVVSFSANPVFVAFRKAGAFPMVRPFGGDNQNFLPRRFRIQTLDLWSRSRQFPNDPGPQGA